MRAYWPGPGSGTYNFPLVGSANFCCTSCGVCSNAAHPANHTKLKAMHQAFIPFTLATSAHSRKANHKERQIEDHHRDRRGLTLRARSCV
jgi:hypothetical protein